MLSIDGRDLNRPTPVTGQALTVTAGGRADIQLTAPTDGTAVRLQAEQGDGRRSSVRVTSRHRPSRARRWICCATARPIPCRSIRPTRTAGSCTPSVTDPGFYLGKPGLYWSVNGHLYPNVPMYVVREGDVVVMTISNHSGEVHPMHLHGHHAVVLSRNGIAATGSPWWVDSLNVLDGETYVIAFKADNPGHLDGPLPQPQARRPGHGRPPDVRGRDHTVPGRRRQPSRVDPSGEDAVWTSDTPPRRPRQPAK